MAELITISIAKDDKNAWVIWKSKNRNASGAIMNLIKNDLRANKEKYGYE